MNYNLWLFTAGLQLFTAIIAFMSDNWVGAAESIFGCWMCIIYWAKLNDS